MGGRKPNQEEQPCEILLYRHFGVYLYLSSYTYNKMNHSRILLISNSTVYGRVSRSREQQIKMFLGSARKVLFFPFALFDRDDLCGEGEIALCGDGLLDSNAHAYRRSAKQAIERADAIFIGGGNTSVC